MNYQDTGNNSCIGKIPLDKLYNTRDLGGYRTMDGSVLLPGRLIRSGALADASRRDLEVLAGTIGVRRIIDFRTPAEQRQKPDPAIAGAEWFSNPILDEAAVGITFEEEEGAAGKAGSEGKSDGISGFLKHASSLGGHPEVYVDRLYQDLILQESAARQYGRFFDLLVEVEKGAVLWHCSAGKDRVGIGTALLLTALGVDRDTVMKDYEMTNEYVCEEVEKTAALVEGQTGNRMLADSIRVLLMVSPRYLEDAFDAAEREYGSMDRYLEGPVGLSAEKRNRLRSLYLTDNGREEGAGEL